MKDDSRREHIHPCEPWFDSNWNKLLMDESKTWFDITSAIWDAATQSQLLSRVKLPSDEEILDYALKDNCECPACAEASGYKFFVNGAKWIKDNISLT